MGSESPGDNIERCVICVAMVTYLITSHNVNYQNEAAIKLQDWTLCCPTCHFCSLWWKVFYWNKEEFKYFTRESPVSVLVNSVFYKKEQRFYWYTYLSDFIIIDSSFMSESLCSTWPSFICKLISCLAAHSFYIIKVERRQWINTFSFDLPGQQKH